MVLRQQTVEQGEQTQQQVQQTTESQAEQVTFHQASVRAVVDLSRIHI